MREFAVQIFWLEVPKEIEDFLEMLLKTEDLIYAVKSNLINYLILVSKNFPEYTIFKVKSEDLQKIYEKVEKGMNFFKIY